MYMLACTRKSTFEMVVSARKYNLIYGCETIDNVWWHFINVSPQILKILGAKKQCA